MVLPKTNPGRNLLIGREPAERKGNGDDELERKGTGAEKSVKKLTLKKETVKDLGRGPGEPGELGDDQLGAVNGGMQRARVSAAAMNPCSPAPSNSPTACCGTRPVCDGNSATPGCLVIAPTYQIGGCKS